MLVTIAVLCALWFALGGVALAACLLSGRLSHELEEGVYPQDGRDNSALNADASDPTVIPLRKAV